MQQLRQQVHELRVLLGTLASKLAPEDVPTQLRNIKHVPHVPAPSVFEGLVELNVDSDMMFDGGGI